MWWRTIAHLPRKSDNSARNAEQSGVGSWKETREGERKEEKKRGKGNEASVCVCSNARYTSVRVLCRELKEKRWHRPGHNIVPDDINELLQRLNRSVAVAFVTRK